MRALQVRRSPVKFGLARITSSLAPARLGPVEYRSIDDPECPGPGWQRLNVHLAGICGSDLSLAEGHASAYFDEYVSFPFVPGHEVVGSTDDGTRYVLNPVLGHAARGFPLPFEGACAGEGDDYAHLVTGHLEPGVQTGFCCSTGGGWAPWLWAHDSQLHAIPDELPDERAVLVEPLAGGIHAALLAWPAIAPVIERGGTPIVAVLGAGTMGLAALAGLRRYLPPDVQVVVGARYPHQIALSKTLGATEVVQASKLDRAVRRAAGCHLIGDGSSAYLSSGAHVTIDAVGTSESITDALRITRPRGRVVLLGMPADVKLDLTGLWHRETELRGAYTYGTEALPDGSTAKTFDLAVDTANHVRAEQLLSATYTLDEHVDALTHAAAAGRRGAVKIAFDPRASR
jgi:threonine dehydrogenase-like Zn-dependent dehydrogenase